MKLKEFIENLNKYVEKNPEVLDLEVITSRDDEGNGFNAVFYGPSKGNFNEGDFVSHNMYKENGLNDLSTNAVCIN